MRITPFALALPACQTGTCSICHTETDVRSWGECGAFMCHTCVSNDAYDVSLRLGALCAEMIYSLITDKPFDAPTKN